MSRLDWKVVSGKLMCNQRDSTSTTLLSNYLSAGFVTCRCSFTHCILQNLHTAKKLMFTLNTRLNDEHVVRTELTHFVKKHHVLDDCADKYADIKACRNFCDVHLEFFESVQQAGGSNHVGGLCL